MEKYYLTFRFGAKDSFNQPLYKFYGLVYAYSFKSGIALARGTFGDKVDNLYKEEAFTNSPRFLGLSEAPISLVEKPRVLYALKNVTLKRKRDGEAKTLPGNWTNYIVKKSEDIKEVLKFLNENYALTSGRFIILTDGERIFKNWFDGLIWTPPGDLI